MHNVACVDGGVKVCGQRSEDSLAQHFNDFEWPGNRASDRPDSEDELLPPRIYNACLKLQRIPQTVESP
jgi:hypothetical protein